MQIYTKILIGMVVGAVIGLALGPQSRFLEHDFYKINDATSVELRFAVTDFPSDSRNGLIPFPSGVPLDMTALETRYVEKNTDQGIKETLRDWVKVEILFSKSIALNEGRIPIEQAFERIYGTQLKNGDTITAWLKIQHKALINETGLSTGFIQRPEPISHIGYIITDTIKPVGDLFLRLISMVIVPLVFCSLLVGVASLGDVRKLGRLGGKTIGIYLVTTAIAVSFGLLLANTIKPGEFVSDKDRHALEWEYQSNASTKMGMAAESPSTIDNLLNIVPSNPLGAMAEGNMLQVIFFAVMLGVALTLIEPIRSKEIIRILDTVQQAMIVIINMVLAVAPYGVAALLANVLGASGISVLSALLVYMLVVLLGMFLHVVLVYGGLLRFIAKIKWKEFLTAVKPAQLIAFSSSSSSATLPVSIECAEKNLKISNTVASFVLPLGSTVNMDGTALYQGVAAVFIAQVFGLDLSFSDQLIVVLTATMASVGAAGVPGAGIITLALVLAAIDIPVVGIALILGVDRLLDMFRTAMNVTGDLAVSSAIAVSEGETLFEDSES